MLLFRQVQGMLGREQGVEHIGNQAHLLPMTLYVSDTLKL
jgi:hypothetical protein